MNRYITVAGYSALKAELNELWSVKRPEVTRKVAEAAAMGDRSENAEYIYGKRQLRQIDARVRFLSKRLEQLVVVDRLPEDRSRIYFGAYVTVEDEAGATEQYRIVGSDEFDPDKRAISVESPLARALLKKQISDEVTVETPNGRRTYVVLAVEYRL